MVSSNFKFLSQGVKAATQNMHFSLGAGLLDGPGIAFAGSLIELPTMPSAAAPPKVSKNVLREVAIARCRRVYARAIEKAKRTCSMVRALSGRRSSCPRSVIMLTKNGKQLPKTVPVPFCNGAWRGLVEPALAGDSRSSEPCPRGCKFLHGASVSVLLACTGCSGRSCGCSDY